MKKDSYLPKPGLKAGQAGKSRCAARTAFSLFCAALLTAAPLSDAFAHGFGGGFGRGGGFSRGGGFGHGGGFGGGYPNRGSSYAGRSSGWGHSSEWGHSSSSYHPAERAPVHQPPSQPVGWGHPPRGEGMNPGRGMPRQPWPHPIYGGGSAAPVYNPPSPPVYTPSHPGSYADAQPRPPASQGGSQQPQNPQPVITQRARSGAPAANEQRFVPDEVMFTVSGPPEAAETIGRRHNLVPLFSKPTALIGGGTMNCYRITDHRPVADVIHDLEGEQQITWSQPNYVFKLDGMETAAQGLAGAQYALTKMHLTEAHRTTQGDSALVAIIDSGIDENHPDIAGAVVDHFDALGGDAQANAHGTAIAGAISAHGALVGVAPHAKILAIRAFGGTGTVGTTVHVIESLNWAYEHHARIVNMSFAGAYDPLLALAINTAHQRGMVMVAAAGNEGPAAAPAYPAADPNVIAVTATDRDDKLFSASNHGAYISVAAPGVDIIAAAPANSYQFSSGTSIAAAHISGVIALLLSEKPDLGADTIRRVLKDTAHDLGGPGKTEEFGAGLGDAARAVAVIDILRKQDGTIAEANARP